MSLYRITGHGLVPLSTRRGRPSDDPHKCSVKPRRRASGRAYHGGVSERTTSTQGVRLFCCASPSSVKGADTSVACEWPAFRLMQGSLQCERRGSTMTNNAIGSMLGTIPEQMTATGMKRPPSSTIAWSSAGPGCAPVPAHHVRRKPRIPKIWLILHSSQSWSS